MKIGHTPIIDFVLAEPDHATHDPGLWDIQDRAPVIGPVEIGPLPVKGLGKKAALDMKLDNYERGIIAMPLNLRARYLRCMSTIDALMQIVFRTNDKNALSSGGKST